MTAAVKSFGITEFTHVTSDVERRVEEIRLVGYTIVPDALTADEVARARVGLDDVYARQAEEIGGEERLLRIGDTNNARALLVYDEFFLGVATNPFVLGLVERLLGKYFVLMLQNGVMNAPQRSAEHNAGTWHRDLNYQHFVCSRPLSVSALFCIDDFSRETGGTCLLPATHKTESFPSEAFVASHEMVVEAKAGSVVVFDSMLFHRGGVNTSANVRRAINHMYTLPLIKQQISFPRMLGGKYRTDPFLAKFLGYESESGTDVVSWRNERIERAS